MIQGSTAVRHTLPLLTASVLLSFSCAGQAEESDRGYESIFLRRDKNGASPDIFRYKNTLVPGMKHVEVVVNDRVVDVRDIRFVADHASGEVRPCLTRHLLSEAGVKTELYDNWQTGLKEDDNDDTRPAVCDDPAQRIPAARVFYDDARQQLRLTLPQEAVSSQRFQMVPPVLWDDGTPALRTAYNGYFYSSRQKNQGYSDGHSTRNSAFVSLNSTASAGPWRLYSFDTFIKNARQGWQKNHDRLYAERNIVPLRARLSAGDIYTHTAGNIMGVIPLRGVALRTSERMMLESQFSYAPVIRGTARTSARLIIRQRGYIIDSRTLTPGPFAIDDMYAGQTGADLEVTVEETDGTRQQFTVPYTSLPNMIRPGATRYSLSAGEYRNSGGGDRPLLGALSLERGFEAFTLNTAGLGSAHYQSLAAGVAWNVGRIGAFALDLAQSRYSLARARGEDRETRNGSAVRMLYARQFDSTDTGLRILGYQYRSEHFLSFDEFTGRDAWRSTYRKRGPAYGYDGTGTYGHYTPDEHYESGDTLWNKRRRSRLEVNINQGMQDYGSLYLTLSQDRYYGTSRRSTSASAGYGFMLGEASVSLSYSYNKNGSGYDDNMLSLGVSLPLGRGGRGGSHVQASYNLVRDSDRHYSQSLGLSGSQQDSPFTWGLNVQKDPRNRYSESASLGYSTSLASLNSTLSHSTYADQFSAGMSGGVLLYKGGAILAPRMGDTIGIVETPGAAGVGVPGGNKTDWWGRAVINHLSPYRYNTVNLDTTDAQTVELPETGRKVVPTEGAAVLLRFATRVGRRAMVVIGGPHTVPVGATVRVDGQDEEAGIVGNNGLTYLTGLDARRDETLIVSWGREKRQCRFILPKPATDSAAEQWHTRIPVNCR
ncbi:fimbrial biogenesis outer membrane usher protein (plasmid) [Escherichia albertii]|uniref:fimbria/pilus outer membrane usher protein n=1 Tax=Escherichia albertii TaxID=208962 RepID=UPI0019589727|nr:fimbria/pilus outer membrane usher protein [Escherichia albertii]QST30935.1 fimbrial biogenesis outer membrane usher protein [Escherichia albertii]QST40248.1 fimbrial biogenesis outer membrane usher protein [Escherichia albertii]